MDAVFNFTDLIIIIIVFAFAFYGLFFGFVSTLGSLAATIFGIYLSSRLVNPLMNLFGTDAIMTRVVLFVILFLLVSKLFGIVIWVLEKVWGVFRIIPLTGLLDRVLGLALGIIEGIIVVAIVMYYALVYLPPDGISLALDGSFFGTYVLQVGDWLKALLPAIIYEID
ncbi:MAG: CvpA family protein [Candidatus Uhrbacteria bacterium]|nr:CvpA family protein [Patescibacteria group bacterium]MBU1907209.1 CvpA family protein [Patescibacteria group bacterium]